MGELLLVVVLIDGIVGIYVDVTDVTNTDKDCEYIDHNLHSG